MLTRKQYDLLQFIHKRLQDEGVPPSFDEMKEALDLRSKSGIHRLITALEERGFIRRLAHRARAIEIIRLPEALESKSGFSPAVIDGGRPERPASRCRWDCYSAGASFWAACHARSTIPSFSGLQASYINIISAELSSRISSTRARPAQK